MNNKNIKNDILEVFSPLFTPKSVYDYSIEELEEIIKTKKRANFNHWLSNQVAEFSKKNSLTNQCITLIDEEEIEKLYNLYSEEEDYANERLEFVLKQALSKVKSAEQQEDSIKIKKSIINYCKKHLDFTPIFDVETIEHFDNFLQMLKNKTEKYEDISELFTLNEEEDA